MMDNKQLSSIMAIILPQLITEIMSSEKISEDKATDELYNSELYSALEDERTKLWHLSPKALHQLYQQEKENGFIEYPEEA